MFHRNIRRHLQSICHQNFLWLGFWNFFLQSCKIVFIFDFWGTERTSWRSRKGYRFILSHEIFNIFDSDSHDDFRSSNDDCNWRVIMDFIKPTSSRRHECLVCSNGTINRHSNHECFSIFHLLARKLNNF